MSAQERADSMYVKAFIKDMIVKEGFDRIFTDPNDTIQADLFHLLCLAYGYGYMQARSIFRQESYK